MKRQPELSVRTGGVQPAELVELVVVVVVTVIVVVARRFVICRVQINLKCLLGAGVTVLVTNTFVVEAVAVTVTTEPGSVCVTVLVA